MQGRRKLTKLRSHKLFDEKMRKMKILKVIGVRIWTVMTENIINDVNEVRRFFFRKLWTNCGNDIYTYIFFFYFTFSSFIFYRKNISFVSLILAPVRFQHHQQVTRRFFFRFVCSSQQFHFILSHHSFWLLYTHVCELLWPACDRFSFFHSLVFYCCFFCLLPCLIFSHEKINKRSKIFRNWERKK